MKEEYKKIPSSENLNKAKVIKQGSLDFPVPSKVKHSLNLEYVEVEAPLAEGDINKDDWGHQLCEPLNRFFYGNFYLDGELIEITEERFTYMVFYEDGTEAYDDEFEGACLGLNVSWVMQNLESHRLLQTYEPEKAKKYAIAWEKSGKELVFKLKKEVFINDMPAYESEEFTFDFAARKMHWRHHFSPYLGS